MKPAPKIVENFELVPVALRSEYDAAGGETLTARPALRAHECDAQLVRSRTTGRELCIVMHGESLPARLRWTWQVEAKWADDQRDEIVLTVS